MQNSKVERHRNTKAEKQRSRESKEAEKKQKGLLPALKSPIVCIYSFFVDILHDLMFFVVHAQASSIRNANRRVVGAQKAICFPKYITLSKTILAFCCPCTSLFQRKQSLEWLITPPKKKTCFGDYLDLYRHVQTSLENIRLLRAQCIVSFVFVFFCFFWFLWVLDSLGLRRKPFLEIDGVPVPVECSWSSLTGVLHIYTEMV